MWFIKKLLNNINKKITNGITNGNSDEFITNRNSVANWLITNGITNRNSDEFMIKLPTEIPLLTDRLPMELPTEIVMNLSQGYQRKFRR